MTIDEELNLLEQQLRRLKIEYEIFFNNPTKRPPTDIEWKVVSLLKKYSDGARISFAQRFRYNEMAQRYAIHSDLWRKKTRIREEGFRRPQDALLSIQGVRIAEPEPPRPAARAAVAQVAEDKPFSMQCSDANAEQDRVKMLYQAFAEAKKKSGEKTPSSLDAFSKFVQKKTGEIRKQYGCQAVEYSVEVEGGHVKLKAKAKE